MATKKNDGGVNLRFDEFVKQVRPDPNKTEPISLLHGYIGESTSDDKIRLYADASLAEYVDIAKTDILYAIPNEQDPLGGSQLWVKQSASVNHASGDAFAQGDMYNDYLGNMYTPGDTGSMAGGAATQLCTGAITQICTVGPTLLTRNIVCRPTRFICPTPNSRLVICTLPPRTSFCPILTRNGCPNPSWVDGCASALGCTIATGTTVINPGRTVQFGADANTYSSGDMYNDYMQNSYEPQDASGGGTEAFGGGTGFPPTSPAMCHFGPSILTICPPKTFAGSCRSKWVFCQPKTCFLGTRPFPTKVTLAGCPSDFCATDFTKFRTDVIGGFRPHDQQMGVDYGTTDYSGADYGSGDMYNAYMQDDYTGEMGAGTPGQPLDTSGFTQHCPPPTQICAAPITRIPVQCGGVTITQPFQTRCCVTQVWNTRCCITRQWQTRCCVTIQPTRCCNTKAWVCFQPLNTLNQCQVQHPNG
jgi:hypothetical protein